MPAKKKTAAKKPKSVKKSGAKKTRAPMSKDIHDLAATLVGQFVTGVVARGGACSVKDTKNKDAVQASGKLNNKRVSFRIAER